MITIEVLISLLILFLVIATSITTIKQLYIIRKKQVDYENVYRVVLNIKDSIQENICRKTMSKEGMQNGFQYIVSCKKIDELKNYKTENEINGEKGNIGNFLLELYQVTLQVQQDTFQKKYYYYKTLVKKPM